MCGFTISINKVSNPNLYSQFQSSLNNISHRGPDASNIVDLGKVTLGHVRLSIIDLSAWTKWKKIPFSTCGVQNFFGINV